MLLLLLAVFGTLCHSAAHNLIPPDNVAPPPNESLKNQFQSTRASEEDTQDAVQNATDEITDILTEPTTEIVNESYKTTVDQESQLPTCLGKLDELNKKTVDQLATSLEKLKAEIVEQVAQLSTSLGNIVPFLAGLNATVSDLQLQMQQLGNKLNNITSQQQQQAESFLEQQQQQAQSFSEQQQQQTESMRLLDANIDDRLGALDCTDHWTRGRRTSGVYSIYPIWKKPGIEVWCNMSADEASTVVLSRRPQPIQENFSRDWEAYKNGFGNASAEYWIGLEALHAMTNRTKHRLHVEVVAVNGSSYSGSVGHFHVDDESSKYRLTAEDYFGIGDRFGYNNGMPFTTIDEDNDEYYINCALEGAGGGGWWYRSCGRIFPTGPIAETNVYKQMRWYLRYGYRLPLSHIVMSVQP